MEKRLQDERQGMKPWHYLVLQLAQRMERNMIGSFLVFVLALALMLLVVKRNNFYAIVFAFSFFGVEVLFLVILMSAAKFAGFSYQSRLEYWIYHMVLGLKANYYDIKRITNLDAAMVNAMMIAIAWKNDHRMNERKFGILYGGLLLVMGLWILALDSVRMQDILYVAYYRGYSFAKYVKQGIGAGERLLTIGCCILPVWRLGRLASRTRLRARKKYLYGVMAATIVLAGIFLCIVCNMPVKCFLWEYEPNDFKKLYGFYKSSLLVSRLIWLFLFGAVVCIMFFLIRFDVLQENSFMKRTTRLETKISMKELRHVFHSYKNALFSMECMGKTALEYFGEPKGEEALKSLLSCADSYYGQLNQFLNIYNKADLKWTRFTLQETIAEARKRMGMLEGISFTMKPSTEDDFVYGDFGELTDLFVNLFSNSRDAIVNKYGKSTEKQGQGEKKQGQGTEKQGQGTEKQGQGTEKQGQGAEKQRQKTEKQGPGEIKVSVWQENMLVCVSVWDNGEGMDKKTRKNLYTPFYTTKKTMNNWGIGMSQIRKTVEAHQGFIDVDSRVGEYTEFQIALPLDA